MLLHVPDVLTPEETAYCRQKLEAALWIDGKVTAGYQSAKAKDNQQLDETDAVAQELGSLILNALERNATFLSAALPHKVFPPLFNRYEGGQNFGTHVDNAIRQVKGSPHRVRTDLSATLFFTGPEEYDGGELVVEDTYGVHSVKLPPGHMVLYPGTSLHHVRPVTNGARVCSFFWVQSMVREDSARTLLFDFDMGVQRMTNDVPDHPALVQLTGVYHNLLRRWAEV